MNVFFTLIKLAISSLFIGQAEALRRRAEALAEDMSAHADLRFAQATDYREASAALELKAARYDNDGSEAIVLASALEEALANT